MSIFFENDPLLEHAAQHAQLSADDKMGWETQQKKDEKLHIIWTSLLYRETKCTINWEQNGKVEHSMDLNRHSYNAVSTPPPQTETWTPSLPVMHLQFIMSCLAFLYHKWTSSFSLSCFSKWTSSVIIAMSCFPNGHLHFIILLFWGTSSVIIVMSCFPNRHLHLIILLSKWTSSVIIVMSCFPHGHLHFHHLAFLRDIFSYYCNILLSTWTSSFSSSCFPKGRTSVITVM